MGQHVQDLKDPEVQLATVIKVLFAQTLINPTMLSNTYKQVLACP